MGRITFRRAGETDAALLCRILDDAFYEDHLRYPDCPFFGRSIPMMERSIRFIPHEIVFCEGIPCGAISYQEREAGEYFIGCLCVIPAYRGRGIGTGAFQHFMATHADHKKISLITPADKQQNIAFYTTHCGMHIEKHIRSGTEDRVLFTRYRAEETGAIK